jgi:ribosomal 50S subunit-recycling heat shock protein
MRHNVRNSYSRSKRLVNQLAAEKKKAVISLCLIGVMVLMWIRVLSKKGPEAAQAVVTSEQVDAVEKSSPALNISFVELPKIVGRNDVITRDFFSSDGWRHFIEGQRRRSGMREVNILSTNGNEEIIKKVVQKKLKLEAIMVGENSRAYINGKTIKVGDKINLSQGVEKYECNVAAIEENAVVIKCREAEITLKLTQESMADN